MRFLPNLQRAEQISCRLWMKSQMESQMEKSDVQNSFALAFRISFDTGTECSQITLHRQREGEDIAVVDDKVGAGLTAPVDFLRQLTGIVDMNASAQAGGAPFCKDFAHGCIIVWMRILFGNTETA